MTATWKQYEGQAVDGIPLLRLLGGDGASAVYLGELTGSPCAIKLVRVEEAAAQIPLARWQQASKLQHPNLAKIHQWGRARLNGASLVYLAMEYGEEVLSGVDRPLTPKEARELLAPAVSALLYLHGQKMAHGRIQPSNILSVNEVLKLSGDAPLRFGERHTARAAPSAYDAPEATGAGVSAAGDVWSLGMTLVEAMAKQLPTGEADPPRLPDALHPDAFREVASGCLRRDPARRWSMNDIQQWLERGTVPAPKRRAPRYLVPAAAAVALVAVGAVTLPHFIGSSSSEPAAATQPAPAIASAPEATSPAEATPPPEPKPAGEVKPAAEPAPEPKATHEVKPAAEAKPDSQKSKTKASAANPPPATVDDPPAAAKTESAPATPGPADSIPEDVVASVRPDPIAKARASVRGKVPITVRLETDASGAVTEAKVESGSSSKYFAELSLKAARQWKFAASDSPHVWLVRFEYAQSKDNPVTMRASKVK